MTDKGDIEEARRCIDDAASYLAKVDVNELQPDEPIAALTTGQVLYVANSMTDVADNEPAAIKSYGEGKYFKVVYIGPDVQ